MKRLFTARNLLFSILLLLLLGAVCCWWRSSLDPWKAVPPQAAIVLQLDSLPRADSTTKSLPVQLLAEDAAMVAVFRPQSKILAALQRMATEQFAYLYIFEQNTPTPIGTATSQRTVYRNQPIYNTSFQHQQFAYANYKNLILLARQSLLVERAIDALKDNQNDWATSTFVQKQIEAAQLFLRPQNLPGLLAPFLRSERRATINSLSSLFTALTLQTRADSLGIRRGRAALGSSLFWQQLTEQSTADKQAIQRILPTRTELALTIRFSQNALNAATENAIFSHYFAPWMHGQITAGQLPAYGRSPESGFFTVLKIADEELASAKLEELIASQGALNRYPYQVFDVHQLILQQPLRPLLGESLAYLQNPYCTIAEGYLILCNSKNTHELFLTDLLVSEVLANAPDFQLLQQPLPDAADAWLYAKSTAIDQLFATLYKPEQLNNWQQLTKAVEANTTLLVQLHIQAEEIDFEAISSSNPTSTQRATIAYRNVLPAPAIGQPHLFPATPFNDAQLLIQDENFTLHCFAQNGQQLWAVPLESKILGDIQEIDYYKNDRQQYVFNTENQLVVLAKNGEAVGDFPLQLQSLAVQGMTVIDFNQTRRYQFFLPSTNNAVYAFDELGRPVSPWNPHFFPGRLASPVQHFQRNNQDFITLASDTLLQIVARDGRARFPAFALEAPLVPPVQFQSDGAYPRIVAALANGKVLIIGLDGSSFKLPLEVDRPPRVFLFADVWGDARKDYIALYGKTVQLWSYDANNDFDRRWIWEADTPIARIFPAANGIGVLCPQKQQIFLLNTNGQVVKGFPLAGTTPFRIDRLYDNNASIVVTARENELLFYRLP